MLRREFLNLCLALAAGGKIRVGCQTRAYGSPIRDREKLLSVLSDLAAVGYEGFETNFASLEHNFADPAPMRAEIDQRGIALIGLHVSLGPRVVEVARAVRVFGGTHVVVSGGRKEAADLPRFCAEFNQAGKACRDLGIRLCAHNHDHELEDGARVMKAVLAGTDASLMVDVGHVFPPEFDLSEIVRGLSRRIAGFHLRDTVKGKEVLMGTGEFDFARLARLLQETGWSGWLIVEVNQRPDMPSRKLVEQCRAHVKRTMKL